MKLRSLEVRGTFAEYHDPIIRKYAEVGSLIRLHREPENAHDPNAVSVWLFIPQGASAKVPAYEKIGYVQRERAGEVSRDLLGGLQYEGKISSLWIPDFKRGPKVKIQLTKQRFHKTGEAPALPFNPASYQRVDKSGMDLHKPGKKFTPPSEDQPSEGLTIPKLLVIAAFLWFIFSLLF